MDKTPIIIVIAIIVLGGLFWLLQGGIKPQPKVNPTPLPQGPVLFFGADCPHCKIVEDYISQNKIADKIKFTSLEVPFAGKTSNELVANAELAIQLAQGCKMDVSNGVSIPFLYDGKNCLLGQDDVINFFKNAAGIK